LGVVAAVKEDSSGLLWVGTNDGLKIMVDGEVERVEIPSGGKQLDVRTIVFIDGEVWIGTRNAGVLRCSVRRSQHGPPELTMKAWFTAKDGLGGEWVSAIRRDDDGNVWIATNGGGLSVVRDGVLTNVTRGGLGDDTYYSLLEDHSGSFWMSNNNGITRVRRADILAYVDRRAPSFPVTTFGMGSGMLSDECNGGGEAAGLFSRNGLLYFPTAMGIVVVNPDSLPVNHIAPSVRLERVTIDRRAVNADSTVALRRGDGDLEFTWTGISLASPEGVQCSFMLDGYDHTWLDAGERRIASYTNIPPGAYVFRVRATNADGAVNTAGVDFPVTLLPKFYETIWFYAVCVIGVLGLAFGVFAFYRREKERQLIATQLESQLAQARLRTLEMQVQPHFLFNTLNGISALIEVDPEKAGVMISRLSDFVRMALERSGSQEVPLREELQFVDGYLEIEQLRFSDRLTIEHEVDRSCLEGLVPTMILQPLVENAIRHGVAKRRGPVSICISAERENGVMHLTVADTGAGLPQDGRVKEGIGLFNTRARLGQLYGSDQRLTLTTLSGGGAEAKIILPYHEEPIQTWTTRHPLPATNNPLPTL
jgi:hypothetical protein